MKTAPTQSPYYTAENPVLQKACLLVIDNDSDYITPDMRPAMAHYFERLTPFIAVAEQFMPVIHVALPLRSAYEQTRDPSVYDARTLRLLRDADHDTGVVPGMTTSFTHPFNPARDLYYAKDQCDAVTNDVIPAFLQTHQIETVIMAGVYLRDCVKQTCQGLQALRQNGKTALNTIILASDLTDHGHEPFLYQTHITDSCSPDWDNLQNAITIMAMPIGTEILSSHHIVTMLQDNLDMTEPLWMNQHAINQKHKRRPPCYMTGARF